MTSWLLRACGGAALVAAGCVALPAACVGSPPDVEVGKLGQRCFPGDFCDDGLTCVATAVATDGSSLGTDGGQCFDLRDGAAQDAPNADAAADAPGG